MGLGKTVSTLNALDLLYLSGVESQPALVVAPLRVAQTTWTAEAMKWAHLRNIEVSPVVGTEAERKAALRRDASVYTLNYENIPWFVELMADRWPFGTIVADESTKLKSTRASVQRSQKGKEFIRKDGGVRGRQLARVAFSKTRRWINLTGTPSPNGLKDLWGQMWFVDQGQRLGRTYDAFKQRWFQAVPGGDGYSQIKPLPFAQEQIEDRLRDVCLSLRAADYFDLKLPIVNTIYVDLPSKARALYRDMEREMFMQLEGIDVEAFNAASRTIKCLQLANGAAYVDDEGAWREVHDVKLQALESVIEEAAGAPVLVAYHFKSDLARLQKAFPQGRHFDKNPQTLKDFCAGKIPVLFIHPASGGHGVDGMQDACNQIVFFGHWWNLEEYQQVIERIGPTRQMQSGLDRPVFVHHIVVRDTVDELVVARRETKREVQDLLMEAMRGRRQ